MQLGQRVAAGAPLMSVDPAQPGLGRRQLQGSASCATSASASRSTLTADVYGKKVDYHGTVDGLGVGTGAAFSLLPAQNATGNWIKVVQRVPVRIALDPKELAEHPLRVGLSMDASVDVQQARTARRSPTRRAAGARADQRLRHAATTGRCRGPADHRRQPGPARRAAGEARPLAPRADARRRLGAGAGVASPHADAPTAAQRRRGPAELASASARAGARSRAPLEGSALVLRHDRAVAGDVHERARHARSPTSRCRRSRATSASARTQGTWVITCFAVANAIAVPLTGWLTQRFGPVRLFVTQRRSCS